MNISDIRLKNFRRVLAERNLRLTDIADRLGKAPAQVSAFGGKNPTKGIGNQIAREIEEALHLRNGFLDIAPMRDENGKYSENSVAIQPLPVLDARIAELWCRSKNEFELSSTTDWIYPPKVVGLEAFSIKVEGMSMEPNLVEGDIVIIDPSENSSPGQIIAISNLTTNMLYLRQLRREGDKLYIYTLNSSWPDRIIELTNDWLIRGRAVYKLSTI